MSELKLLPCPFCGEKPKMAIYDWGYSVKEYWCYCSSCGCETQKYHSKEDAIAQWNERKPMSNIVEKLEEEKGKVVIDGKEMYQEDYFIDIDKAINIVKQEINNGLE